MKILLLAIGRTKSKYLEQGIADYSKRLSHYAPFHIEYIDDLKNTKQLSEAQQKGQEGQLLLAKVTPSDFVVLLDEHGSEYTSLQFATYLQKRMSAAPRRLVFIVGGPYGFAPDVYHRANDKISLSKMTLSHEMVRLVFVEQLYRGFTILNHEPYHHE